MLLSPCMACNGGSAINPVGSAASLGTVQPSPPSATQPNSTQPTTPPPGSAQAAAPTITWIGRPQSEDAQNANIRFSWSGVTFGGALQGHAARRGNERFAHSVRKRHVRQLLQRDGRRPTRHGLFAHDHPANHHRRPRLAARRAHGMDQQTHRGDDRLWGVSRGRLGQRRRVARRAPRRRHTTWR